MEIIIQNCENSITSEIIIQHRTLVFFLLVSMNPDMLIVLSNLAFIHTHKYRVFYFYFYFESVLHFVLTTVVLTKLLLDSHMVFQN